MGEVLEGGAGCCRIGKTAGGMEKGRGDWKRGLGLGKVLGDWMKCWGS